MIDIDNRQYKVEITDEITSVINDAIQQALKHEQFSLPYEVSVVITDNLGIQAINFEFRKLDKCTDVLSFPMLDYETGYFKNGVTKIIYEDTNPENGAIILGDIVISIEKAVSQAEEYGHSYMRELAFLVVHSVLHLLGHDHNQESDKIIMRNKEEDILNILNLLR